MEANRRLRRANEELAFLNECLDRALALALQAYARVQQRTLTALDRISEVAQLEERYPKSRNSLTQAWREQEEAERHPAAPDTVGNRTAAE